MEPVKYSFLFTEREINMQLTTGTVLLVLEVGGIGTKVTEGSWPTYISNGLLLCKGFLR